METTPETSDERAEGLRQRLENQFDAAHGEILGTLFYCVENIEDARDALQETFLKCWRKMFVSSSRLSCAAIQEDVALRQTQFGVGDTVEADFIAELAEGGFPADATVRVVAQSGGKAFYSQTTTIGSDGRPKHQGSSHHAPTMNPLRETTTQM